MSNPSDFVIENGVLTKYVGPGGDVVIPEDVTSIGDRAFQWCSKLTSVTVPEGVTGIGNSSFSYCQGLTRVSLPSSLISIGEEAFCLCRKLTSVTIPKGTIIISCGAFRECSSLIEVLLPADLTIIDRYVFLECSNLKSVVIPVGVTSIGEKAFRGCHSLASINIPEGVASIGNLTFGDCRSLTSVTIPNSVTSIGDRAFWGCSSLTSVTIPASVTSVGEEIFDGCNKLRHFVVPDAVKSLGKNPFGARELPKGLTPQIASLYHALTDGSLKQYLLSQKKAWDKLPQELQIEIYLTRQGKSLNEAYKKCVNEATAEQIGRLLYDRLNGKASLKDCNTTGAFMTTLYEKVSEEQLKGLYSSLKKEKNGAKSVKTVEETVALMEKLGGTVEVDTSLSPAMQKVMADLIEQKMTLKDFDKKLKDCYALTPADLPILCSADGREEDKHVLAWLLMAHERLQRYDYGQPDLFIDYKKPGIRPEAAEIVALLDQTSLQRAITELADQYLVAYQSTKKKFLAYPFCRYANESAMADITKRAPQWRTSVSGDDAPPLLQLREAAIYSDTRAAMLFAERYHELDKYAAVRGMTVDELRDKYLSDVGLDEQGGKVYDLGSQTVTARLQKDLSFLFELPNGKTAKSLPKKGADEEKYSAAKADFDEMRKAVKKILKSRGAVLFEDFLSGRKRSSEEWQSAYMPNPVLRLAAGLIVWAQGKKTFTLLDGKPVNSSGQDYAIGKLPICVAHPMEMQQDEVKAWQKFFSARGLKQPFAQVWEPVIDPETIKEDRYAGSVQPAYRFAGKDRHGIHSGNLHAYSEDIGFELDDCALDFEASSWRAGFDAGDLTYTLGKFSFSKYTRKVNHIVSLLDSWTVEDRLKKDDISVMDLMSGFTLAQITEFIKTAQEANAVNVLALLLEYKNVHFADFDPMDEFTLEW